TLPRPARPMPNCCMRAAENRRTAAAWQALPPRGPVTFAQRLQTVFRVFDDLDRAAHPTREVEAVGRNGPVEYRPAKANMAVVAFDRQVGGAGEESRGRIDIE